ncbi:hypothetical protein BZZ01_10370 [Nostocales cyanobacterium HT-58-2]|nr:hypothetical protein BZZ01_10370 [Nostocales cyanobacterium HT-58-2]
MLPFAINAVLKGQYILQKLCTSDLKKYLKQGAEEMRNCFMLLVFKSSFIYCNRLQQKRKNMTLDIINRAIKQPQTIEQLSKETDCADKINPEKSQPLETPKTLNFKKPIISVFGSTGFIGSNFCHFYKDEVIKISKNDYETKSQNILYLISTTHNNNVFTNPHLDIDTNLKILLNVLEKCKDKKIVFNFISSYVVYGDCKKAASESTVCHPKGFYSITKKCAEDLLVSYCKTFGIVYRILRLGTVYGNLENKIADKKRALSYFIEEIKNNRPIELYYYGKMIRDYMHINDMCRAIYLVMESAPLNSVINIGSGIPYQLKDVIYQLKTIIGSHSKINLCSAPEFYKITQPKDIVLDVNKLKLLGFQPTVTFEEGMMELCS